MSQELTYLFDENTSGDVEFSEVKRAELLEAIEEIGAVAPAAAEVGLTIDMLVSVVNRDPRLEADIALAGEKYRARLLRRMQDLAFNGTPKMVVGGKNRDIPIGEDIIPNDKALELLAKMKFADDLAIVTRQRISQEVNLRGSKDEVQADFDQLTREERKQMAELMRKAKKIPELKEIPDDGG